MVADEGAETTRIPDTEMPRLLELIRGADSVELKMTVQASEHRTTISSLGLDPIEAQIRQVFFFDTPELALNEAGVVVRARRIQGGRGDTVVKLRPVVPADLRPELRKSPSFNVEVDALPGGFVCSGSMKGRTTAVAVHDAVAGAVPLREVFSKDQRAFYRQHAPAGVEWESLVPLGPTFVLKLRFPAPKLEGRTLVAEVWLYPDGSRILELSTKCLPAAAFQVAAETRAYLAGHGVTIGGHQQTKTKAALDFFSAELRANATPAGS
jgi:hypothetical protein